MTAMQHQYVRVTITWVAVLVALFVLQEYFTP